MKRIITIISIIIIVISFAVIIYAIHEREGLEKPLLKQGLVPIVYDNGNIVVANKNHWYDYNNKEWANSVTLTNEYSKYRDAKAGTIIPKEAINTMWVWIPRFSYYIDNVTNEEIELMSQFSSSERDKTVEIKFINKETTDNGTGFNGSYKTPTAFTFGQKVLSGIWIGKFETSTNNTAYIDNPNYENAQNVNPTILPKGVPLRFQKISTQFETSLKICNTDEYGIKESFDSHMMKNSEWEIMSLLSLSKYGNKIKLKTNNNLLKTEIEKNIESNYSTTGNITGIFDTENKSFQYVMARFRNYAGVSEEYNSGYEGYLTESKTYITGKQWPDKKYYDIYTERYSQFNIGWPFNALPMDSIMCFIARSGKGDKYLGKINISTFIYACGDADKDVGFRIVLT